MLRKWVAFHYTRSFTGVLKDRNDVIKAVGIARPIMKLEDARDWCAFDNLGSIILVELAIAPTKRMFQGLGVIMKRRFGERESIALHRYPERKIRVYPFAKIMRHTLRREKAYGFA